MSAAAAALAIFVVCDLAWRRIPNVLTLALALAGVAGGILGAWSWSWWGMLAGFALVLVADFPGGDVKAAAVLGGYFGLVPTVLALALAMVATLATWRWTRFRQGPWLVYVAGGYVVAIAMLSRVPGRDLS